MSRVVGSDLNDGFGPQVLDLPDKPGIPDGVMWGVGLRHCIILGLGSEIAGMLKARLERDEWTVSGRSRSHPFLPTERWDLLIVAQGTMRPIGRFFDCDAAQWEEAIQVNALAPLRYLRELWPQRKMGAKVVFISGPNPTVPTPTYSAYRAGKSLLESLISTLNSEGGATFHWLIPGIVKTKIHLESVEAGNRAENIAKVLAIVHGEWPTVDGDEVYRRLRNLIA